MGVNHCAHSPGRVGRAMPFSFTTTRVEFPSRGVSCRGWFYQPDNAPLPGCVVMAHGFGASPDGPLGQTASRFAEAGLAALIFD